MIGRILSRRLAFLLVLFASIAGTMHGQTPSLTLDKAKAELKTTQDQITSLKEQLLALQRWDENDADVGEFQKRLLLQFREKERNLNARKALWERVVKLKEYHDVVASLPDVPREDVEHIRAAIETNLANLGQIKDEKEQPPNDTRSPRTTVPAQVERPAQGQSPGSGSVPVSSSVPSQPPEPKGVGVKADLKPPKPTSGLPPDREMLRTIIGYEQAGASAAKTQGNVFANVYASTPFPLCTGRCKNLNAYTWRVWGDVRLTSLPLQTTKQSTNDFAVNFLSMAVDLEANKISQGLEFLAGGEYLLFPYCKNAVDTCSFRHEGETRYSLSFIFGGGATTPLVTDADVTQFFKVDSLLNEYAVRFPLTKEERDVCLKTSPDPANPKSCVLGGDIKYISFLHPDRERFYRQYYGGFRFKTYYPATDGKYGFPGFLDVTFGQNEAVTKGKRIGILLRLDGFYPLKFEKLDYIYLFGTGFLRFKRSEETRPIILEPVQARPDKTVITQFDEDVFRRVQPTINRDYYRFGIGVDLNNLFGKFKAKK